MSLEYFNIRVFKSKTKPKFETFIALLALKPLVCTNLPINFKVRECDENNNPIHCKLLFPLSYILICFKALSIPNSFKACVSTGGIRKTEMGIF